MARRTAQRSAIRKVLEDAGRPMSPAEILRAGQLFLPKLGLTTVYRTINALVKEGWLTTVELPGDASRYELAGKAHHHHFRCRTCDAVFDVKGCLEGIECLLPEGFALQSHALVLYGVCMRCEKKPAVTPQEQTQQV
jgi:Fur family ferric uptake transcriptional regulator